MDICIMPSCLLERLGFVVSVGISTMSRVCFEIVRNGVFGHLDTFSFNKFGLTFIRCLKGLLFIAVDFLL